MDRHSLRSFQPFTLKQIMIFTYLAIFKKMTNSLMIWSTISSLSRASTGRWWFPVVDLKAYDMSNFWIKVKVLPIIHYILSLKWCVNSTSNYQLKKINFFVQFSMKWIFWSNGLIFFRAVIVKILLSCSKTNSYHKG